MKWRDWAIVSAIALVGGFLGGLISPSPAGQSTVVGQRNVSNLGRVVRVERLELIDERGNIRAVLSVTDGLFARFAFLGKDGKPTVLIGSRYPDAVPFFRMDSPTNASAFLGPGSAGDESHAAAELCLIPGRTPSLIFYDKKGTLAWQAP